MAGQRVPTAVPRSSVDGIALATTATVGRPFRLGMLYDCRTDTIVSGLSLWDNKTIQKMTRIKRMENSTVQIITEDSMDEKSKHLGISGEGKLGIASGLVDVSGSAQYVNDTKSSEKHTRVSLHYQSISDFRDIDIDLEKLRQSERLQVAELGIATHVVTGVLYGADAVFVFDHVISKDSKKSALQLQGEMKASIKKLQLEAKAEMHLNEEQEGIKDNMSCKFYGDVILKALPTTFTEARDTYDSVIKQINIGKADPDREEKVVPKKVWLLPLNAFIRKAPNIGKSINDITVSKVQAVVDEFQRMTVKVNDLKTEYSFPPFSDYIQSQLDDFLSIMDARLREFKTKMKELLPKIRGGKADEKELLVLLEKSKDPPFDQSSVDNWLKAKENEAKTFKSFFSLVSTTEGVEVAGTAGQFNNLLISSQWEYLLALEFKVPHPKYNPLGGVSPSTMLDYLLAVGKTTGTSWVDYMSPAKVLKEKALISRFANFVTTNHVKGDDRIKFVVTLAEGKETDDVTEELVSMKLYKKGESTAVEGFEIPSKPKMPIMVTIIDDKTNDPTGIKVKVPEDGNVYIVILTNERIDKPEKKIFDIDTPEQQFEKMAKQKYTISVQVQFVVNNEVIGLSEKNEKSFIFPIKEEDGVLS